MTSPVVLITGALTGIGRATAQAFAREGARIVVSGRRDEEGKKLADELRAAGADALLAKVRLYPDIPAAWSIGPSSVSAAWTWRSTTRVPKASPVP